jgi:hypothetical protein
VAIVFVLDELLAVDGGGADVINREAGGRQRVIQRTAVVVGSIGRVEGRAVGDRVTDRQDANRLSVGLVRKQTCGRQQGGDGKLQVEGGMIYMAINTVPIQQVEPPPTTVGFLCCITVISRVIGQNIDSVVHALIEQSIRSMRSPDSHEGKLI